jgi:cyclase
MRNEAVALILSLIIMVLSLPKASDGAEETRVHISQLEKNIYKITYILPYTFVHLASIGEDGIFLIDTGAENTAQDLLQELKKFGDSPMAFILNTHAHHDHIGGNPFFEKETPIFAHINVKKRYSPPYDHLPAIKKSGAPIITFTDTITFYMNDQTIIVQHLPSGHTDGDSIVYFPESEILYIGDLIIPGRFSTIDLELGGNVDGFLENLNFLISHYPDKTRYIPTHGQEHNKQELRHYYDAFIETLPPIKNDLNQGKTVEQIVESGIFENYKDWIRKEDWVEVLKKQQSVKSLPSICEPLTKMVMEKGIDETLIAYTKLKTEAHDKYIFAEDQLNTLGYQLLERKMIEEAISIFIRNTEEYPSSSNVYDSLGEAYFTLGKRKLAEVNFKKALKLDPNNIYAKEHLKLLQEKKQ